VIVQDNLHEISLEAEEMLERQIGWKRKKKIE
jgi:hypothetical protein